MSKIKVQELGDVNPNKERAGRAFACFTLPIVGVITYFMEKDEHPEKAKNYGLISLLGAGVYAAKIAYKQIKKQ